MNTDTIEYEELEVEGQLNDTDVLITEEVEGLFNENMSNNLEPADFISSLPITEELFLSNNIRYLQA